ncbi:MAG: helix-turn-helix transcriptional regulator [bacterium]
MINKLGERLKKIRSERKTSQREFAKKLGISYVTLCNYETEKRELPLSIFHDIIQMFNISPQWLLTGEGNMLQEGAKKQTSPFPIEDLPKEQIKQWLDDFWIHASPDERTWIRIEMKKKFPEFAEWLKKIGEDGTENERCVEKLA